MGKKTRALTMVSALVVWKKTGPDYSFTREMAKPPPEAM